MAKNFFGITDTGKMRKNNEDTFIAKSILNDRFIAACVIDGVGGYEGGEVAAKLAHDAILDSLKAAKEDGVLSAMLSAFESANERIYKERQLNKDNEQMACVLTLALVDIKHNKFYYTHVGDTRLYLFRDSLVKVSRDHSFVGFLEDSGRLSEDAAMRHPKRNEINKALGFDAQIASKEYIESGESPFLPGDMLLLCSDGLTDMVNNSAITAILNDDKTLEQKGKALIDAANDAGGKDNITVVLVFNDKPPRIQEATKPVSNKKEIAPVAGDAKLSAASKNVVIEKKKNNSSVPILSVLCILLLASTLWLLYKTFWAEDLKTDTATPQTVQSTERKERNEQEKKFISDLNTNTTQLVINDSLYGKRITISDSIIIQNDSLHIVGNGASLVGDSVFRGPAFIVSPSTSYLLLDSIILENFDVGILLQTEVLHLKNVQFKNCRVPIQFEFLFPNNTVLNGKITDSIFKNYNVTDSL